MIDRVCSIILALAAMVCAAVIVRNSFFPSAGKVSGSQTGEARQALLGTSLDLGQGTQVVLAVSSHCIYCQQSMPFYKKLAATKSGFSLVVLALENETTLKQYLDGNQLPVDSVTPVPLTLPVQYTPTMLIVHDGKVKDAWVGLLRDTASFEKSLKRVCPHCQFAL